MTGDISDFFVHEAQVETWQGTGAYGAVYAAPVTHSPNNTPPDGVLAEDKIQLVRNKDGEQVVSGSTLYMGVAQGALYVPESRVTVDGKVSYVITQNTNDAPGLGLPEHAAITLK
jgi:hypothetical protein